MNFFVVNCGRRGWLRRQAPGAVIVLLFLVMVSGGGALLSGCRQIEKSVRVRPRTMRDVPAERLAFRFEADVNPELLPASLRDEEIETPLPTVKTDFETRRLEESLLQTVVSPDGHLALALYATSETPEGDFRLDLYSAEGKFLRNILPANISGTFSLSVAWSPDGQQIAFIGIGNSAAAEETATPDSLAPPAAGAAPGATTGEQPAASPEAAASVAPLIAPVPAFSTEQIYVGDRNGFNLRPLTTRDGLIYFHLAWAPDAHAIAALATKESEWSARREENKAPAGRPRLITLDGGERLLSDNLTDVAPVWSPDSSKVATAYETDVAIYDALSATPTAASIRLREQLLAASTKYDAQLPQKSSSSGDGGGDAAANQNRPNGDGQKSGGDEQEAAAAPQPVLLSFNPIVRLEWLQAETLLAQTAFLRIYRDEPVKNFPRWHIIHLSPQAVLLSYRTPERGRFN